MIPRLPAQIKRQRGDYSRSRVPSVRYQITIKIPRVMAKIINETETTVYFPGYGVYKIYVEESKCNWYVTLHRAGWACPSVQGWKASKRDCKTARAAYLAVFEEAKKLNRL